MKASGNETAAPQSTAETRRISLCTNLFWKKHEDAVKNIINTASEIAQQLFFVRLRGRSKTSLTFESASQYIMAPGKPDGCQQSVASVSESMFVCAEQKGICQKNEGDCEKIERDRQN